jgi:hypothetical protein
MVELAAYAVGERHLERCLSESQIQNLQNKAAEGTMHIELEQLRKVHQFQASDADINQFIQNVKQLEQTMKQRGSTYKATGTFETATGTTTIEAKKSCYVATAVFETPFHPNVILLQSFRDLHLTRFWLGKRFIAFYYKIGPFLAGSVLARGLFKKMTRGFLNGVCNIIRRAMN